MGKFYKFPIWPYIVLGILWLFWQIFTDELAGLIRNHIPEGGVIMYSITHPYVIMPILLLLVSLYFLWRRYKKKAGEQQAKPTQPKDISKPTERILIRIHKRMLELESKAYKKFIQEYSSKEFLALNELIATTIPEYKSLEGIQEKLKGKKISKIDKRKKQQVDNLDRQIYEAIPLNLSLNKLTSFANNFNRLSVNPTKKYKGLDALKGGDSKLKKLLEDLKPIKIKFGDAILNRMIDEYVSQSYGSSSLLLYTDLIHWYIPPVLLPTRYLESEAYNPAATIESYMEKFRIIYLTTVVE